MSGFSDDQRDEVEALQSIYPEEFELLDSASLRYQIHLEPNTGADGNHVGVCLVCTIPPTYPDVKPDLDVVIEKGLSRKQREELLQLVNSTAEENVGMPMVFTICEALKEWLGEHNVAGQDDSMHAQMVRRMQTQERVKQKETTRKESHEKEAMDARKTADEDEDTTRRRREGTPVTPETFAIWKARFDAEMRALGLNASSNGFDESKPTGKQLFLSEMAGDETALTSPPLTSPTSGERPPFDPNAPGVEISEDLFEDGEEEFDDEEWEDEGEEEEDEEEVEQEMAESKS